MILTEAEAKTKWCPMTRYDVEISNIPGGKPWCLASGCMAWRCEHHPDFAEVGEQPRGFCGLAGKP